MDVRLPDGTVIKGVPDGISKADLVSKLSANGYDTSGLMAKTEAPKKPQSFMSSVGDTLGNIGAGAIRGAGSIGATILTPIDAAARAMGIENDYIGRTDRREAMDYALQDLGADPKSMAYQGGKLGAEIAGTAGAGGLLVKGATKLPMLAKNAPIIEALRTGGMSTGSKVAPLLTKQGAGQLATRVGSGATVGGTSAALVNPDDIGTGAGIGAFIPAAGKAVGSVASFLDPQSLMQSALKPTIAQLRTGDAQTAVDTLLKYGVNATKGGVEKLKFMSDDVDQEISDLIKNSGKTVPKQDVLNALQDVEKRFATQVSPTSDIAAIQNVGADFAQHPMIQGQDIPIELAQDLKKGTYRLLEKKYGQLGSAETEAQKGLARGLKEGIATQVPEVAPLNAKQSDLITTMKVAGRRAMMDENKNPIGLAGLASNPLGFAAMMADKSALVKSLAARGINAMTPEGKKMMLIEGLREGIYKGAPVAPAD